MVNKNFQMEIPMKVNTKTTKGTVKGSSGVQTEISMKVNGKTTKGTVKGPSGVQT